MMKKPDLCFGQQNKQKNMKHSLKTGLSFGLTSGVITTLGLMVGLEAGTNSKMVVLGGIFTIAVADAFSDALGIHVSEESENKHSTKEIWESTIATFISKFIFALTFIAPVLLLDLKKAIIASIVWGLLLLGFFSYYIAKQEKAKVWEVVTEHIAIGVIVIIATHYVGHLAGKVFG